jgi:hypothetical protein
MSKRTRAAEANTPSVTDTSPKKTEVPMAEPDASSAAIANVSALPVGDVAIASSAPVSVVDIAAPASPIATPSSSNRAKFKESIAATADPQLQLSPAGNRDRFRQSLMPLQVTCDLSSASTDPGMRFSFQAIVLVVYPASNNPLRRHVLLGDGRGTVGLTVWNSHVQSFSFTSIGHLAIFSKVSLTNNNGVRGLVLSKESTISFSVTNEHFAQLWWNSIVKQPAVPAIHFHDAKDNVILNVSGILGNVVVEQKNVRMDSKELLQLQLVDRTGIIMVRSWNHGSAQFGHLVDRPILIQRVRVTSFAGMKIAEMMDGTGTVIIDGDFDGAQDLSKFWSE